MKSKENLLGAYAVLIGVILALTLGFFQALFAGARQNWIYISLAIIGVIIGLVSVGKESRDATTFLLASISLVIVGSMGQQVLSVGEFGINISVILDTLLTMFIPATIVVALKTVFSVASIK